MQAAARYLKQVSKAVKTEIVTSHTGQQTYEAGQETYSCSLRLKSSAEEDQIKTQPGSAETCILNNISIRDNHKLLSHRRSVWVVLLLFYIVLSLKILSSRFEGRTSWLCPSSACSYS